MAGARWKLAMDAAVVAGLALGGAVAVNDQVVSWATVRGPSMHPTFDEDLDSHGVLVDRIARYDVSRGDVVLFRCPRDHKVVVVNRVIGLPGDRVQIPGTAEVRRVPEGHCWMEGDNAARSCDSRNYGAVPVGLMLGKVRHIVWPPHRIGPVESKMPEGRIVPP